jgi:hypothetical protein
MVDEPHSLRPNLTRWQRRGGWFNDGEGNILSLSSIG